MLEFLVVQDCLNQHLRFEFYLRRYLFQFHDHLLHDYGHCPLKTNLMMVIMIMQ